MLDFAVHFSVDQSGQNSTVNKQTIAHVERSTAEIRRRGLVKDLNACIANHFIVRAPGLTGCGPTQSFPLVMVFLERLQFSAYTRKSNDG